MNRPAFAVLSLGLAALLSSGCASPKGDSVAMKRQYALDTRETALDVFYDKEPGLRAEVSAAAGYVVFSNFALHPLLLTFANGYGVAEDNGSREQTHMRMFRFGLGPGLAVKGMYLLIVFKSDEAYDEFVAGRWGTGALAEASFQFGEFGGSAAGETAFSDDLNVYVCSHTGFALELFLAGAKFYPKDSLN